MTTILNDWKLILSTICWVSASCQMIYSSFMLLRVILTTALWDFRKMVSWKTHIKWPNLAFSSFVFNWDLLDSNIPVLFTLCVLSLLKCTSLNLILALKLFSGRIRERFPYLPECCSLILLKDWRQLNTFKLNSRWNSLRTYSMQIMRL